MVPYNTGMQQKDHGHLGMDRKTYSLGLLLGIKQACDAE